jgi:predicted Zn-dependent protease with MMP-like domain
LKNDVSADGTALTMVLAQQPSNFAFFAWNKSGRFVYQPRAGFVGTDTFTYYASNGVLTSNLATVTITMVPDDGATLLYAGGNVNSTADADATSPSQEDLLRVLDEAIARWTEAGVPRQIASTMSEVKLQVQDLPGNELARVTKDGTIYVDVNAAGCGWFVDSTPSDDEEFAASAAKTLAPAIDLQAAVRVDLLTTVMHELGHVAGLPDVQPASEDLMSASLGKGLRRLPGDADIDLILAQRWWLD